MTYKLPPLPELTQSCEDEGYTAEQMNAHYIKGYKDAIAAIEAQGVPDGWSRAGHFYNLVMHALMDVGANHDGARWRLKEILKELESLASAPPAPQASEVQQEPVAADAERYGKRLNDASWAAVEAWNHEVMGPMTGAIFNNIKGVVRAAILKYCEGYTNPAPQAKPQPLSDPLHDDIQSVLFEVEESIKNGACPWQIKAAFEAYEAARRLQQPAHGITKE